MPSHTSSAKPSLIILGIRGVPAAHGGFETFAERLALWLVGRGWDVTVYCQGSPTGKRMTDEWEGIRRIHIPVRLSGAMSTIEFDAAAMKDAMKQEGAILTLGYNTGFLNAWARLRGRRSIINMDGFEWKRDKYGPAQKAFLWANERLALIAGATLIADHPVIADYLKQRTAPDKVTMIPYGGEELTAGDEKVLDDMGLAPGRFFTIIARPEPENSILEIVRAFSRRERGAKLVVLGNYREEVAYERSIRHSASAEVLFPGAIYDKQIVSALRFHSRAYLHGHRVGGTNPSLVEALGAGNAIIAHDNPFNRWVAGEAGLYFADEEAISDLVDRLIDDGDLQAQMAAAARARWHLRFTWERILQAYEAVLEVEALC